VVDDIIPPQAEQAALWRLLRREVDRLEQVAARFLSFARPSEPRLERCRFADAYGRVEELVRAHVRGAGAAGVTLAIQPLPAPLADRAVRVDPDQIAQVALNLASNALGALAGAGHLRLSAALRDDDGPWIDLRFENDGPAIPADDLERIFDPFFTRAPGGTGLGLSIAVRIVDAHGGSLRAENLPGARGVAFTVRLPAPSDGDRAVATRSAGRAAGPR
jgi:signal transduction histidine kinase